MNEQENEQFEKLLNSNIVLRKEDKDRLDTLITEFEAFHLTVVPSDKVEREEVYSNYRAKISEFGATLAEVLYNFQVTREEYLFLKDTLLKKLEYNRENVFVALMVRDEFFGLYDDEAKSTTKTTIEFKEVGKLNVAVLPININDLTRISHLLGLHVVKDITTKKAEYFASVVKKIGDIAKVGNYFTMKGNQLKEAGSKWLLGFDQYDSEELGETTSSVEEVSAEKID
jgi:hypothetical protein